MESCGVGHLIVVAGRSVKPSEPKKSSSAGKSSFGIWKALTNGSGRFGSAQFLIGRFDESSHCAGSNMLSGVLNELWKAVVLDELARGARQRKRALDAGTAESAGDAGHSRTACAEEQLGDEQRGGVRSVEGILETRLQHVGLTAHRRRRGDEHTEYGGPHCFQASVHLIPLRGSIAVSEPRRYKAPRVPDSAEEAPGQREFRTRDDPPRASPARAALRTGRRNG